VTEEARHPEEIHETQEPEHVETVPPALPIDASNELQRLRLEVTSVRSYQKGLTAFLAIVAVFAAIVISVLGWLGISNTIDRFVQESVGASLDSRIEQVQSDLQSAVADANTARSTAESASSRAETFGQLSSSSAATAQVASDSVASLATQIALDAGKAEWIVGVASLPDLQGAQFEVTNLVTAGYAPSIYHIGDQFVVSIGSFEDKATASTAALSFQSVLRRSTQLFNLSTACPFRRLAESGYFVCSLEPFESPSP